MATAWKKEHDPLDRFWVVDTGAASGRLGLSALAVARFASGNPDAGAVLRFAREALEGCREYVFLDRLRYLAAGGRLSRTGAVIGDSLRMKPVISPLADGARKVGVVRDRAGQFRFALSRLEEAFAGEGRGLILLEHTDNAAWVTEAVRPEIARRHPGAEILVEPMSLTSGAHMGPGTWAVAFLPGRGERERSGRDPLKRGGRVPRDQSQASLPGADGSFSGKAGEEVTRGVPVLKSALPSGSAGRFAILIPVYNHVDGIGPVIERARGVGMPIWVVDDGSTDGTAERLDAAGGITVIRHGENLGKGAALLTGFKALAGKADWAVTLDADGQHDPLDVPKLIRAIRAGARPIVIGRREGMAGKDVPWTSRFGRKFSNFWVRCAGGPVLSDTQSGMRVYPLPEAAGFGVRARRFQFEVEVLVRARWAGIPVVEATVGVTYPPGIKRISHFRPFIDFCRNSATFTG